MLVLLCYSRLSVAEVKLPLVDSCGLLSSCQEPSNAIQSAVVPLSAENYDKVLGSSAISIVYFHNPANATAEEPIQREFEFAAVLLQRMVVFSRCGQRNLVC